MENFGKTIKFFLIDGDVNKRISCELSNWTGKAYKIPRILVNKSSDREDLSSPGVYFLLGKSEGYDQPEIYIGEAETIIARIKQHFDKEFWSEVIVFISKDNNLNKAHIKYLESRLYKIATEVKTYKVINAQEPTQSSISESDTQEMEEFIYNLRLLTNSLGCKAFDAIDTMRDKSQVSFEISSNAKGRECRGEGVRSTNGFVVYKGTKIAPKIAKSMSSYVKLRERLIKEEIIDSNWLFTRNYEFSSPSAAAAVILGRSATGLEEWKVKGENKMTLKKYESQEGEG